MWIIGPEEQNKYLTELRGFVATGNKAFLCNRLYKSVIGSPPTAQAIAFYYGIMKDKEIYAKIEDLLKLDTIGAPTQVKVKDKRFVGLNTTRYLDTIRLLKENFNNLNDYNITEIGVGFGGLAHCIKTMWNVKNYHLIDFTEAINFASDNLKQLGHTSQRGAIYNSDLAIAEYSITEHTEDSLFELTDKHLMTAKNIFVRCNILDNRLKEKWLNHLKTVFDISVSTELGDVVKMNCIVVGKKKYDN